MATYRVQYTVTYYGHLDVEADDHDHAKAVFDEKIMADDPAIPQPHDTPDPDIVSIVEHDELPYEY